MHSTVLKSFVLESQAKKIMLYKCVSRVL